MNNNMTTVRACCTCLDQHFCMISKRCPDKSLKYWTNQLIADNEEAREFSCAELEAEEHRQRMIDNLKAGSDTDLWDGFSSEDLEFLTGKVR
jgi:hypothetical protein